LFSPPCERIRPDPLGASLGGGCRAVPEAPRVFVYRLSRHTTVRVAVCSPWSRADFWLMSIKLMTAVWAVALIHTDKLVLLALADNANDEGLCWPSVMTLTQKCGMDARTVQRVVTRLCDAGHMSGRARATTTPFTPGVAPPRQSAAPAHNHRPPAQSRPRPRHSAGTPPA
jgi:hypothetical protein